jgi:DNA-binding NtrC family response regulator
MSERVLVVDDDASICETFEHHLGRQGHEVVTALSAEAALALLPDFAPALVITDIRMPGIDGIELLKRVRGADKEIDVLVITAHEDMATAVSAMKAGAYDYLVKPLDLDQIDLLVERCFRERSLRRRVHHLTTAASEGHELEQLVGRDPAMIEIYKLIGVLAENRATVLIRGETGTGKELIARAIHFNSPHAGEPFVAVNCTALAETLLESELFGHVRGAFTGAVESRKGYFELAGDGTVFLDEIGDMGPELQAKILRVLEERDFYPVGGERPRTTKARVIAATHRPLEELVHKRVDGIAEDAMGILSSYDWPGNVRELENTLTRAAVLARGAIIGADQISLAAIAAGRQDKGTEGPRDDSLEAAEAAHVQRILNQAGGNKRQAARILGISRPRLDRLVERYGLDVSR